MVPKVFEPLKFYCIVFIVVSLTTDVSLRLNDMYKMSCGY